MLGAAQGIVRIDSFRFCYDHLGTVHALVSSVGSVLSVVESYRYDAWGNVLAVYDSAGLEIPNHKSQISNRFLFQGREHSFATGLTHFRARWYDPATGRWLSNDPIGISGGLNQYVFCGNDPVDYMDPWGLDEQTSESRNGDNWVWFRPRGHDYITGSSRPNLLPITGPLGLTPGGYITGNLEDYVPFFHQLARLHDPLSGHLLEVLGDGSELHVPLLGPVDDLLMEMVTIPPCYIVAASGTIVATVADAGEYVGRGARVMGQGVWRGAVYLGRTVGTRGGALIWEF